MQKIKRYSRGFSLLEMLIYISVLVFILAIIMNVTVSIVSSQRSITAQRNIENSAISTLERITRELRQTFIINSAASTLGSDPGVLVLNGEDDSGNPRTVEFYLSSGQVVMEENDVVLGPISQSDARVTSLVFNLFSGINSQGVRTEMTIESGTSTHSRSETFYASAVLR